MKRHRYNQPQIVSSQCGEVRIRGNIDYIITSHEKLGNEADINKDYSLMHLHYQHADHYRRIKNDQRI